MNLIHSLKIKRPYLDYDEVGKMIIESIIIGGALGKVFHDVDKAQKLDAKGLKKLSKAYEKQAEASLLIQRKKKDADEALLKVMNRKRGIMASSMKQFVLLYQTIIRLELQEGKALILSNLSNEDIGEIQHMTIKALEPISNAEIAIAFFKGGIGGLILKDSERDYAQANRQLRSAEVVFSQAENIGKSIDILIRQCNAIADVLAKLNVLFMKSIQSSQDIIEERGQNRDAYTREDRNILMTCMNLAKGIKGIIDAPVVQKGGTIANEMNEAIKIGEKFLEQTKSL